MVLQRLKYDDLKDISLAEAQRSMSRQTDYGNDNLHVSKKLSSSSGPSIFKPNVSIATFERQNNFEPLHNSTEDESKLYNNLKNSNSSLSSNFFGTHSRTLKISPVRKTSALTYRVETEHPEIAKPVFDLNHANTDNGRYVEPSFDGSTPSFLPTYNEGTSESSTGDVSNLSTLQLRIRELKDEIDYNAEKQNESLIATYQIPRFSRTVSMGSRFSSRSSQYNSNNSKRVHIQRLNESNYFPKKKHDTENYYNDNELLTNNSDIKSMHSISPSINSISRRTSSTATFSDQHKANEFTTPKPITARKVEKEENGVDFELSSSLIRKFCDEEDLWSKVAGRWFNSLGQESDYAQSKLTYEDTQEAQNPYIIREMVLNSLEN